MTRSIRAIIAFAIPIIIGGMMISSSNAAAHLPIFQGGGPSFEEAFELEHIETSYAIYGELDYIVAGSYEGAQFFKFHGDEGQEFYFQMNVPAIENHLFFAPDVLLVGPGLPNPGNSTRDLLDLINLDLPDGTGIVRHSYPYSVNGTISIPPELSWIFHPEKEFEPFGQVYFYQRQENRTTLPTSGTFYIVVLGVIVSPKELIVPDFESGLPGKYLLAPGEAEEFGFIDYASIPLDWIRIRTFWGENPALFMLPTYLTIMAGMAWFSLRGERRALGDSTRPRPRIRMAIYAGVLGAFVMIGGGLNQLMYVGLAAISDSSILYSIAVLVIVFQISAILLGILGYRTVFGSLSARSWLFLILPFSMAIVGLLVGAGFIVGPIMVLSAVTFLFLVRGSRIANSVQSG